MIIASSCTKKSLKNESSKEGALKEKVFFDLSHKEIFSPLDNKDMGYSNFLNMIEESGFEADIADSALNATILRDTRIFVYAGPMTPFTDQEIRFLTDYVAQGGGLLILLHISNPTINLLGQFDLQPTIAVVKERENIIDNHNDSFYINDLDKKHLLFNNIEELALYGSWGIRSIGERSEIIAWTGEKAWVDINKDNQPTKGELSQKFGVVGVSEYGQGRVAVLADDALLINKFINQADNQPFGMNLIKWLSQGGQRL